MLRRVERQKAHVEPLHNEDLLGIVLIHVKGDRRRGLVTWDTLCLVCKVWRDVWYRILRNRSHHPDQTLRLCVTLSCSASTLSFPILSDNAFLSVYERESRVQELVDFQVRFRQCTASLRIKALELLRCHRNGVPMHRNGVPMLLGLTILELAFSLTMRRDLLARERMTFSYSLRSHFSSTFRIFSKITRLRLWAAQRIERARHFREDPFHIHIMPLPRLPRWYPTGDDRFLIALR